MTEYCPNKNYTYISTSNFGDKKKVTEELLRAFCSNDAYLKRKVDELTDLTDPETTKRFYPPYFIDESKSFGIVSGTKDGKPVYKFNNSTSKNKIIDFNPNNDDGGLYDDSLIDYDSSNVEFFNDGSNCGARIKLVESTIITPVTTKTVKQNTITAAKEVKDAHFSSPSSVKIPPVSTWYMGFRATKNYALKPEWKKDPLSYAIPAVNHAMKFKSSYDGLLTKVDLLMGADKTTTGRVYVEIRTVDSKGYPSTNVLARTSAKFSGKGADASTTRTFNFDKPAKLTKGSVYAICVRTSLGKYTQTYHIGGWKASAWGVEPNSKNAGTIYISYNNGKTWLWYGKETAKQLKRNYKNFPRRFGFTNYVKKTQVVTTVEEKTTYNVDEYNYYPKGTHSLYMKVPIDNPISSLTIASSTTTPTGTNIKFYVSDNNRNWNQNGTTSGEGLYDASTCPNIFNTNSKPTFLFIRADLTTTDVSKTPTLNDVTLTMNLLEAKKAYLRSSYYVPDKDIMLPACIWSEVDTNYENNYADVKVDLVREIESEELISLKTPTVSNFQDLILDYDEDAKIVDTNTDAKIKTYCTQHTDFVEYLKTLEPHPIYILGKNDNNTPFFTNIELFDYPAYPLLNVQSQISDITQENGDNDSWTYSDSKANFKIPINLHDQLLEVTLFRETENGVENIELEEGTLGSKVDQDNSRYADFNYDKTNNKLIFDLDNNTLFKSYCTISNNKITAFKDPSDASKIYQLKIAGLDAKYSEWLDFTVDYNNKTITWEDNGLNLVEGYLKVEYNPLFVRDLTEEDFPLKLDLWTETIEVTEPLTEFVLRSYPVDSLRLVAINYNTENEEILTEGIDFTVDYQNKKITFNNTILDGNIITIKYTPAITDNGLSLAYRMDRTGTDQDCYIYSNSFTTRT